METKMIPGFNGRYFVTDSGIILNSRGKILRPATDRQGYKRIVLSKNNCREYWRVHRLVLLTFVGENKLGCNHIDGNKSNNNIENLEYCTQSENMKHAFRIGLSVNLGIRRPGWKPANIVPVIKRTLDGIKIKEYSCRAEAGRDMGIDPSKISGCCLGKRNTAGGFVWSNK